MHADSSTRGLGVYVHVPFCERICPYCDFAVVGVGALEAGREAGYVDALLSELDWQIEQHGETLRDRRLETIYLGGGTPSLLRPGSLARLLDALRSRFVPREPEITLELNPGWLERERVPGFHDAGVTRVSVGVQSLADDTLRRLGRAHSADEARRGLAACLDAGFASVSADLIYGAPGQSEAELARDLDELIELGLPHVSAYALTLEPDTPFFAAAQRGKLDLPDEDTVVRMSARVCGRLAAAGLERYEISSFARAGHRSRHNQRYWTRQEVLGVGVSAASLLDEQRFQNRRSLSEWQRAVEAGESPIAEHEHLDTDQIRREWLFLGFRRLEGIDRAGFEARFGAPPEAFFAREIAELRKLALLHDSEGCLRLTERGLLFADEVLLRFA